MVQRYSGCIRLGPVFDRSDWKKNHTERTTKTPRKEANDAIIPDITLKEKMKDAYEAKMRKYQDKLLDYDDKAKK